jgi:tRNA A-37 threonylcarbamoyl transferase component Bud32
MGKIAWMLGSGPEVNNFQGFDILVFKDCIEFAMEYCETTVELGEKAARDLRRALLHNHLFQLIHFDIKLENVCYLARERKYVLIDYGLSEIVPESAGCKSFTKFKGTLTNSSPEMA